MGRFRNDQTGVVVSVDDSKDARFAAGFTPVADGESDKAPAKKAASSSKSK